MEFTNVSAGPQTWRYHERGAGPAVLCVHGFPDTPHSWDAIADSIAAKGFRVIVPYLRGYHPDTIVPGRPYDGASQGADIIGLMDALGVEEAALVGHDWGASGVFAAEAQAPGRVTALVPIGIPHSGALVPTPQVAWFARHFVRFKLPGAGAATRRNNYAYLDTLYNRWSPDWSGAERDACVANAKRAFADDVVLEASIDYYRDMSPPKRSEATRKVECPGLLITGDDVPDLVPMTEKSATHFWNAPAEVEVVKGAGHWPHREDEAAMAPAIAAFLAKHLL